MELWAMRTPEIGTVERQAARAEEAGWDGITFTDSQNLVGDPFVAVAIAAGATERLRFATGVSNVATRLPAALATVAVTVNEESGGRFVLGIGRGDTALFHLGRTPQPVAAFSRAVVELQTYLEGGTVDCDGFPSRLHLLDRTHHGKVPIDIASSGPKVIDLAARVAERVTLAVGADPARVAWAIDQIRTSAAAAGRDVADLDLGAYVNVGCHPDVEVGRQLIRGGVAAFAHFSAMPGSTGAGLDDGDKAVVEEVGRRYDSRRHLRNDADHTEPLASDFVDRFAVVGPPEVCIARLRELADLGIGRFVITSASFGADRDAAVEAEHLLVSEILPALREASPQPA